jgi:hypothetical protein
MKDVLTVIGSGCTPSGIWCGSPAMIPLDAGAAAPLAIRSGAKCGADRCG